MFEWWTYSPSDFLMFAPRTYYRLFDLYNRDIWPAQLLALASGVAMLAWWGRTDAWLGRAVAFILALAWLWIAWGYFVQRYDQINLAARYFAVGFALQGVLMWGGAMRGHLRPRRPDPFAWLGLALYVFALIVYPLIGPVLAGRPWTQTELFGIAPDPTAMATLGLLLAAERTHWHLLVLPLLWCFTGGTILLTMRSPDALVIVIVGLVAFSLAVWKSFGRSSGAAS